MQLQSHPKALVAANRRHRCVLQSGVNNIAAMYITMATSLSRAV
jgi:hypothetical protein